MGLRLLFDEGKRNETVCCLEDFLFMVCCISCCLLM